MVVCTRAKVTECHIVPCSLPWGGAPKILFQLMSFDLFEAAGPSVPPPVGTLPRDAQISHHLFVMTIA